MGDVSVKVAGKSFLGWKDVLIQRSLDSLCATFNFAYTDAWNFKKSENEYAKWYLKPGDACEIYIDDELLITGYIDQATQSYDGENRTFGVSGRDKTLDLVDCTPSTRLVKSYANLDLGQIAAILAEPFGIQVVRQSTERKRFRQIGVDHGQSVFDVLDGLAKQRAVLLTTDTRGRLVLTVPGSKKALVSLEEGSNIYTASVSLDHKKRFSDYAVYGQSYGDNQHFGASAQRGRATATDPVITRHRPRTIVAERDATRAELTNRAQWESKNAAAKSVQLQISVLGWRQGLDIGDPLWEPNMLVQVSAKDLLGVQGEMLIEGVTFRLSEAGEVTELSLVRPDAWVPNPIVKDETKLFINVGKVDP